MTHVNLNLKDLRPGFQFPDPSAPPAIGADALLFRQYATMIEAELGYCRLDDELSPLRFARDGGFPYDRARLAEIESADTKLRRVHDRAQRRFLAAPARTAQGVLLKIAYGMSMEIVSDDGFVSDSLKSIYSAMIDLERMASGVEPVAAITARARERRIGLNQRAAA